MILPEINRDSLTEVSARILELEKLDLCGMSASDIKICIQNSFYLPYHIFPQVAGSITYRALVGENNKPFDTVERISYNKKPANKIGRANLIGETAFYASGALDTAAIEVCQDNIRTYNQKEFFITIGHWRTDIDLEIDLKCHSKIAQEAGTDLFDAALSIDTMMRAERSEEEYQIFLLESEFYSNQFAKSLINCQNDYLFSAVCASQILNHNKEKCDGIWYPSVAYKYKGFNAVYKPSLFDKKIFNLFKATYIRVFFNDFTSYPEISVLAETTKIDGEKIYWD